MQRLGDAPAPSCLSLGQADLAGPWRSRGWGDPWVLSRPCPLAHRPLAVMGCSGLPGRAPGATCPEEPKNLEPSLGGLRAASWAHVPMPRHLGEGHITDGVESQGGAAWPLQERCALPTSQCWPRVLGPPAAMPWVPPPRPHPSPSLPESGDPASPRST